MPQAHPLDTEKCLPLKAVMERTSLSSASVYRMMKRGEFPRSRKIGSKTVWLESEVTRFLRRLPFEDGSRPQKASTYLTLLGADE